MKIRVESFYDGWVRFFCDLGRGEAKWRGKEPQPFKQYSVELTLEAPVEVTPAAAAVPLLDADRDRVLLRGYVEQSADGGSCVRVGEALVFVDGMYGDQAGKWLAVRASALQLFDTNV